MKPWLHRSLIQIRYREAYLEWCRNLDGEDEEVPEDLSGNAYLIKSIDGSGREYARKCLSRYWKAIAEEEFEGWCTDASMWPKIRTFRDFEKFFDWEAAEIVVDLEAGVPLKEAF